MHLEHHRRHSRLSRLGAPGFVLPSAQILQQFPWQHWQPPDPGMGLQGLIHHSRRDG